MFRQIQLLPVIYALCVSACVLNAQISIPTVLVGDFTNPNDSNGSGIGSVTYGYRIGTTEVTNGQYTAFLNSVAATDTHELFNNLMEISRIGDSGSFTYSTSNPNAPVNYVIYWDAARFANWLTNGQPTGTQDLTTTETGMYFLNGVTNPVSASRLLDFSSGQNGVAIASEGEWYKAAYYDPGPGGPSDNYWLYATRSDGPPTATTPNSNNASSANYGNAVGDVTVTGGYTLASSYYGTFDQSGNVGEMVDNGLFAVSNLVEIRGGWYSSGAVGIRSVDSTNIQTTLHANTIGFRVTSLQPVPEPSTYVLVMGGLALLVTLKKRRRCRG